MAVIDFQKFETLSPFEIKDELIHLAKKTSRTTQSAFLNAGRGNPNWIATTPREGYFLLGQFAVTESKRVMEHPAGLGGMPQAQGIAQRLEAWLAAHSDMPGASFLSGMVPFAVEKFRFDPDAFVHELVDSIIGDNYPVPDRMLQHNERITHEYLMWAMCGDPKPAGKFDLYAVEGGTAAMCYIFKSLKANRLLHPGDTIALATPIFTPYIEMTHLEDYDLKVVNIECPQENRFQPTRDQIRKLEDPKIKAFFVVNPGNPTGMALSAESIGYLADLVKNKRPDLILLTDDVYGTFVPEFRSLLGELPYNTIGVYSYSKYFGATGWRLGVIAVHQDNIFDRKIAELPNADLKALDKRYGGRSSSSTALLPTAAMLRSITRRGFRCRSR
jgi:aspartate 4-decarboxylase